MLDPAVAAAINRAHDSKLLHSGDIKVAGVTELPEAATSLESATIACLLSAAAHLLDTPLAEGGSDAAAAGIQPTHTLRGKKARSSIGTAAISSVKGASQTGACRIQAGAFLKQTSSLLLNSCGYSESPQHSTAQHAKHANQTFRPPPITSGAAVENPPAGASLPKALSRQGEGVEGEGGNIAPMPVSAAVRLVGYLESVARLGCEQRSSGVCGEAAIAEMEEGNNGSQSLGTPGMIRTICVSLRLTCKLSPNPCRMPFCTLRGGDSGMKEPLHNFVSVPLSRMCAS